MKLMLLPVCTLSPICSSDIVIDLPFSRVTLAVDGKQPPPDDGAAVVVVVVVVVGTGKNVLSISFVWELANRSK